jgi:hypothetical protein
LQQNRKRISALAILAAAALASPVALAADDPVKATNLVALPSETMTLDDVLVRTAVFEPVGNKYVKRKGKKKPRFLPPNPCRLKKDLARCKTR